jgi:hypothetical protein
MTESKDQLPVVLKQRWIVTMPDGTRYDAGSSYHLSEAHRVAYVQEVAGRLTGPDSELEEPIGDPAPVPMRENFYREIVRAGGSYRIK